MEVRFRPLQSSNITRHVSPGQPPTGEGQSFLEVVESVAGGDAVQEQNPNAGQKREQPPRRQPADDVHRLPAQAVAQPGEPTPETKPAPPKTKLPPDENPLGTTLDLTG
jgi:hypothetical protein